MALRTSFLFSFSVFMQNSSMLKPAIQYLTLRSLGAPAVLLSLAMQGVFRGLKDTKTPLYATSNLTFTIFVSCSLFLSSKHLESRNCSYLSILPHLY